MKKLILLLLFIVPLFAFGQRSRATHDLSGVDANIVMDADVGNKKTFTCEVVWENVIGSGAKAILRGSLNRVNFSDLGIEVVLTSGSGFATLSDDKFPHDFGSVFIQKNGATSGTVNLRFLAK